MEQNMLLVIGILVVWGAFYLKNKSGQSRHHEERNGSTVLKARFISTGENGASMDSEGSIIASNVDLDDRITLEGASGNINASGIVTAAQLNAKNSTISTLNVTTALNLTGTASFASPLILSSATVAGKLVVDGQITANGGLISTNGVVTNAFQLTNGAVAGYGLISDAQGNGTWQAITASAPPLTANIQSVTTTAEAGSYSSPPTMTLTFTKFGYNPLCLSGFCLFVCEKRQTVTIAYPGSVGEQGAPGGVNFIFPALPASFLPSAAYFTGPSSADVYWPLMYFDNNAQLIGVFDLNIGNATGTPPLTYEISLSRLFGNEFTGTGELIFPAQSFTYSTDS